MHQSTQAFLPQVKMRRNSIGHFLRWMVSNSLVQVNPPIKVGMIPHHHITMSMKRKKKNLRDQGQEKKRNTRSGSSTQNPTTKPKRPRTREEKKHTVWFFDPKPDYDDFPPLICYLYSYSSDGEDGRWEGPTAKDINWTPPKLDPE